MSEQLGFDFGEKFEKAQPKNDVIELKIKNQKGNSKNLSKQQKAFNRNTQKVEKLTKRLTETRDKLERLTIEYNKRVPKLNEKIADKKILLAQKIDGFYEKFKFLKREKYELSFWISELLEACFENKEPNDKEKALYDKHSELTYDEENEMQGDFLKGMLADMLKGEMGLDIDPDEIPNPETATPEEMLKFKERVEKLRHEQLGEEAPIENPNQKKKTKKQLEKEQKEAAIEEEKKRSVRSVYLSLAKVLHPDANTDDERADKREDLMKQVTVAYKEKDLATLLRLEMEWLHNTTERLDELTDEKLQLYNGVLVEQISELTNEINYIYHHPKFAVLQGVGYGTLNQGMHEIEDLIDGLKDEIILLDACTDNIINKKSLLETMEERQSSFDMEDSFFWGGDFDPFDDHDSGMHW